MATRIIEYGSAATLDDLPIVPQALVVQTPLTASGSSQLSAAFGTGTRAVLVQSDQAIHVATGGTNPTATTSYYKIAAGGEQFFEARAGDKIAIIQGS